MENKSYIDLKREQINGMFDEINNFIKHKDFVIEQERENVKNIRNQLLVVLKSKIGDNIYWASNAYRKYETHTISDVKYEVVTSDFFGEEYVGKECIKIFVDDGVGYYLADDIDKTLFFDETEAYQHTYQYLEKEGLTNEHN